MEADVLPHVKIEIFPWTGKSLLRKYKRHYNSLRLPGIFPATLKAQNKTKTATTTLLLTQSTKRHQQAIFISIATKYTSTADRSPNENNTYHTTNYTSQKTTQQAPHVRVVINIVENTDKSQLHNV